MTLKNGTKVTTKAQWETRRKEIIEDFEREVVGRMPTNVPKVTWTVAETVNTTIGCDAGASDASWSATSTTRRTRTSPSTSR